MKFIVIGNVIVYLLAVFAGYQAISFLGFSWEAVKHFEVWRLVTFLFMPGYYSTGDILWLAIFLYLYYMIGNTLEREWGTAKFTLYYLCGVILTLLTGIITGLVTGQDVWIAGANYVNLSMFFAFAMLYPDTQLLVMFIIPVKVKWLALLDGVVFAVVVIQNLIQLNFLGALLPVVALLNFFVFFWTNISDEISYRRDEPGTRPPIRPSTSNPLSASSGKRKRTGLPPQVRGLRPHRYRLPRPGVPVLLPLRGLSLLLPGPHLQSRALPRMNKSRPPRCPGRTFLCRQATPAAAGLDLLRRSYSCFPIPDKQSHLTGLPG
ncbi:MAG: rhomboid family intramembrane serine protease [Dysosmobacter sp.]